MVTMIQERRIIADVLARISFLLTYMTLLDEKWTFCIAKYNDIFAKLMLILSII